MERTWTQAERDARINAVAMAMVARYLADTDEQYVRAEMHLDQACQRATDTEYREGEQKAIRLMDEMEAER